MQSKYFVMAGYAEQQGQDPKTEEAAGWLHLFIDEMSIQAGSGRWGDGREAQVKGMRWLQGRWEWQDL